ncbi:hypothetical protein A5742_17290 [Mycolicibacterium fortuitum]|uniref:PknH-like extracellular domain-containing protein n=2 Tax=Mycolicibacterium fortuitum TaxID=1766 RepID=A0ABD6QTS2_MYCFO|nr:hypothetical protein A5742_17290 [Mycolicibacterium fortuitum]
MGAAPIRGGKRKWALVGAAVAVAVVAAIGGAVAVKVTSGGSEEDGSTAAPRTSAAPIPVGALKGLLLTPAEAAKAVGTDKLVGPAKWGDTIYEANGDNSIVTGECVSVMPGVGARNIGSGFTAVRRQNLINPPQIDNLFQEVVSYPSAELAQKFISSSEEAWRKCSGRTINVVRTGQPPETPGVFDVVGPVTVTDGMIAVTRSREGTATAEGDWSCSVAATARNNVVLSGEVCGRNKHDAVAALVRGMAEKADARK